jgi:putative CocE/NonD family hydrolase
MPSDSEPSDLSDAAKVDFHWGVKVPLRDGICLSATVYRPRGLVARSPCIFALTPYIAQTLHERGLYFASHGYPFLSIDVRGRGNSEGEFRSHLQEANDGYDVVEWLARQAYCDGQVAMWGGSYAGYDQWATAKEFPPHLATIVPVASPYMGLDSPMVKNIFSPWRIQWLTFVSGRTGQDQMFWEHGAFWRAKFREWFESGRPFRELDAMVGNPSVQFQEWVSHPDAEAYWDQHNPSSEQYARLSLPILSITGCYDSNQPGALAHYREHMRVASATEQGRHYLIIGPWDHAGTRTPQARFGGIELGPASLLDLPKLHLEWYAWAMAGGPRPAFLEQRVAYYVMGRERWRYAESLDGVTAAFQPYYLDSGLQGAGDVLCSGMLSPEMSAGSASAAYSCDPRDVRDARLEAMMDPSSLTDQRMVFARRGKALFYHTPPLLRTTEVSGFFKLVAWIGIDQPDTDFEVSVYEIALDGGSLLLARDRLRARYRDSARAPQLVPTRDPLRYEFNRFNFISRRIAEGHRLRLVIGPIHSIYCEKNYNRGGVVAEESSADARTVTVTLHHDPAHPSALWVPIGQPDVVD